MIGTVLSLDFLFAAVGSVALIVGAIWFGQFVVALGGIIPLGSWLVQIIAKRILQQWDFTLSRGEGGLRIERGLLSRTSQTIPYDRVQGIAIKEPFVWRRLGWQRLEVDVAGYAAQGDDEGGTNSSSILLPIADRPLADAVIAELLPGADVDRCRVRAAPRARGCSRRSAGATAGSAPTSVRSWPARAGSSGRPASCRTTRPSPSSSARDRCSAGAGSRRSRCTRPRGRSTPTAATSTPRDARAVVLAQLDRAPARRGASRRRWRPRRPRRRGDDVAGVQPAVRDRHLLGGALAPARGAELGHRIGLGRVEAGEQLVQVGVRRHHAEPAAYVLAGGESLEIPRDVLAELDAAALLAHEVAEQLGVPAHDAGDLAEGRQLDDLLAGERGGEVAEQPRPAEAAAADDDAVDSRSPRPCGPRRRPPRCRRCRARGCRPRP